MELTLLPRRKMRLHAFRPVLLAIAALLAGWLVLLFLVPTLFGLETTVVRDPESNYDVGSLMMTRSVPTSDLASSDVLNLGNDFKQVSFTSPGVLVVDWSDRMPTNNTPNLDRVLMVVPFAGLPLAAPSNLAKWSMGSALAAFLTLAIASSSAFARGAGGVRLAA